MPKPKSPVVEGFAHMEITYAKDHPVFDPIPTLKSPAGVLMTRWTLTDQERNLIALGADIFLSISTSNQPLQPLCMDIIFDHNSQVMAAVELGVTQDGKEPS